MRREVRNGVRIRRGATSPRTVLRTETHSGVGSSGYTRHAKSLGGRQGCGRGTWGVRHRWDFLHVFVNTPDRDRETVGR